MGVQFHDDPLIAGGSDALKRVAAIEPRQLSFQDHMNSREEIERVLGLTGRAV